MKLGFAKANLIDAVDWPATTAAPGTEMVEKDFSREQKFDIADRVIGMWRPEDGGKRHVVQPLHVTVMVGVDENGAFVFLPVDHCEIPYQDLDIMREPIISELGIDKDRIVFLPSHCHVTLAYDAKKLQETVLSAVQRAREAMNEVEVGALHLRIEGKRWLINRRLHVACIGTRTIMFNDFCQVLEDRLDATHQVTEWIADLGGNPSDYAQPEQRFVTNQQVDDRLQSLFFRDAHSKNVVASFVRFPAHAVIVSEKKVNGDISADYPGYLKAKLENDLGGVALFAQGQSGDLRPLNPEYSHRFAQKYGEALASQLLAAFDRINWQPLQQLQFFNKQIHLPLRKNLPRSLQEGEQEMNRIEALYDQAKGIAERRKLQNEFWFYYRSDDAIKLLRPEWREKGAVETPLFGLKLNDQVIVAHSGELFFDTGLKMIQPFVGTNPIICSLANECLSYIPPRGEFAKGGYEPSVCLVAPYSAQVLIDKVRELLAKIYSEA